ncbi:hypothetical protein G3N58_27370 [Paraburkholderia sp. Ac-20342]|uniref:hypothetical protein n=1 Tax=unclassified Paraburkholderia TaxID=2615204 RepID=UPI00141ECFA2|nr:MULTISPECIES: hypothetical protein [unclassified Paraburkholderia]MBN3850511.1 hypothetical protein [Paraburkholderia sp. Ac-20342]NIF77557.1 hypothetical protein [Paraburkholderia sp. Cy-641]
MATLARKVAKVLLFCGLYFLAIRYVHTYPIPMTLQQQQELIVISDAFGVADTELFYILAMMLIDLIVTIMVYSILLRLWLHYRKKK